MGLSIYSGMYDSPARTPSPKTLRNQICLEPYGKLQYTNLLQNIFHDHQSRFDHIRNGYCEKRIFNEKKKKTSLQISQHPSIAPILCKNYAFEYADYI